MENEKCATAKDVKEAYMYGYDCGRKHGNEEGRQDNPDSHLAKQQQNEAYQLGLQRGRDECRGCPKTGPVVSEEAAPVVPIKDSERIDELFAQLESVKESLEGAHERIEQLDQNNKAHGRWHDATQFGPRITALELGGTPSLDRMQREHSKALVELRQGLSEVTHLAEKLRTGRFSVFQGLECRVTILEDR